MSEEREKKKSILKNNNTQNKSQNQDKFNDDHNDINNESMTASYSEISFYTKATKDKRTSKFVNEKEHSKDNESCSNYNSKLTNKCDQLEEDNAPQRPASLICDKAFPYNLEGMVSKDGDMTYFVAENLEFKIKLSSPVTKKDSSQPGSSKNGTPSAGLIPEQFFLLQQPPQIDSNVLNDIEIEAQFLAASVDNLTENLCNLLHSISSITADNVEIHKNSVNKLTDNMDANIKSMYTIMAKTEEITKSMQPTEQLAVRIREIKRLVDMLESIM